MRGKRTDIKTGRKMWEKKRTKEKTEWGKWIIPWYKKKDKGYKVTYKKGQNTNLRKK